MLGTSSLQQWYASADSLQVKPKVIAEWNANAFAIPYIYGHGDSSFTEITTISNSTGVTITNDGSLGSSAKKISISFPYSDSFTAKEHIMTVQTASSAGKAYRLSFLAKTIDEVFKVAVIATAKDSSGNIVEQNTSNFVFNSSKNTPYVVDCFSYDGDAVIATMEYTFSAINNSYESGTTIIIDSPRMYVIEQSEMLMAQYSSVADLFKINRPGDPYIYTDIGNGNVSPYYMAYTGFINATDSSWKKARNFLAAYNAAFKYYFYKFTAANNSSTIFAKYFKKMPANKIILKVNSIKNIPSSIAIYTLDSSGNWGSATNISSPFDNNGLAKIYWNGTTWTKSAWSSVPEYINGSISLSKNIYGIKVVFTSTASTSTLDNEVHLVEISPRLELDISSYVQAFSITSELSNDALPTPISISNSNTASISLVNLPDQQTKIQPFDNYSGELAGMLGKNVSVRIIVDPYGQDASKDETQIASMITTSWTNNGIDSSSIEMYDKLKILSTIPATSFYKRGANPAMIVSSLLDSVGFTDYNYNDLYSLGQKNIDTTIPYYWTVTSRNISTLQAIQDVLLPYQISMYVDPHGVIRFKHISEIVKSAASSNYMITDVNSGNIKSNILSFNAMDENAPSKISVEYNQISPMEYTSIYDNVRTQKNIQVADLPQEILGYIKLAETLEPSARSLKYKYEALKSGIESFSGYLLIGSEIIQFDGVEYYFKVVKTDMSSAIYKQVVRSLSDIEYWRSFYYLQNNVRYVGESISDGQIVRLCNLTRGCFGSGVKRHPVGTNASSFSSNGSITSNGYSLQINKNSVKAYATYLDDTCNSKHRVFSGVFTIPESSVIPGDGGVVEFGLSLGASTNNTSNNSVQIGARIYQQKKSDVVITYKIGITIKQYDASGTEIFKKFYDVGEYQSTSDTDTISGRDLNEIFINRSGPNTIVAMFNPDTIGATSSGGEIKNLSVIVNGSIIKFDDGSQVKIGNVTQSSLKEFSIPAIKLPQAPSFNGTKIAGYSNGIAPIQINALQAFEVQPDNSASNINTNLTLLASVMNGNLLGLSNKNELESVVRKQKVLPSYNEIGYISEAVGREIRVFDIDYTTKNTFPVLFSFILRSPYNAQIVTGSGNNTYISNVYIPSESVTVSSIDNSPSQARFAMINSYTEPVYINASDSSTYSANKDTTIMIGSVLTNKMKRTLSAVMNEDNSDSEISLKSEWIQSEQAAADILGNLVSASIMKKNAIDVEVFGNPLIEVGDVLNVQYTLKNFPSAKYAVVSVRHSYDHGIKTSITLRRIQA